MSIVSCSTTSTTAYKVTADTTGTLVLQTGSTPTTAVTIDTAQNLGLGVTPSAWGSNSSAIQNSAGTIWRFGTDNIYFGQNYYFNGTNRIYSTSNAATEYQQGNGLHRWFVAGSGTAGNAITFTQAMTLDASGNLLVGTTSTSLTSGVGTKIGNDSAGAFVSTVTSSTTNGASFAYTYYSTGAGAYRFYVGAGGTVFATSTTISSLSDQRHKENIRDLNVGLAEVMALKPRLYDWKEGKGQNIKNARGFIAQEFEEVFPDLIDEWADPAPEGEEPYKSVRQDLIPVLVKAIQEQQAIIDAQQTAIETLTNRISALENK